MLSNTGEAYRRLLISSNDFVQVPMPWKLIEPQEQKYDWTLIDEWMELLRRARMPVVAGPIVAFNEAAIPAWLYIWEHDYETVRDFLYEHIERSRHPLRDANHLLECALGPACQRPVFVHVRSLMDLTRMTVGLVKKISPTARTLIELTQPWSEYYATNRAAFHPCCTPK